MTRKVEVTQGRREPQPVPTWPAAEFLNLVSQVRIMPGHNTNSLEND